MRRLPPDPHAARGPRGQGADIDPKDADAVDSRVEQLTRELAEAINDAEAEGRVVMRDYAIDLLRDSVGSDAGVEAVGPGDGSKTPPLNPFALGIPVLLIGVVLTFIFPPVGVALLLLGSLICIVGVAMAMFRSARQRGRSRRDVQ